MNDRLFMAMHELDRILNRQNMTGASFIDAVEHRR